MKSRIRWLLVFWLFLLSAVAYLDRVNLSVAGTRLEADYHYLMISNWVGCLALSCWATQPSRRPPAGWQIDGALGECCPPEFFGGECSPRSPRPCLLPSATQFFFYVHSISLGRRRGSDLPGCGINLWLAGFQHRNVEPQAG